MFFNMINHVEYGETTKYRGWMDIRNSLHKEFSSDWWGLGFKKRYLLKNNRTLHDLTSMYEIAPTRKLVSLPLDLANVPSLYVGCWEQPLNLDRD